MWVELRLKRFRVSAVLILLSLSSVLASLPQTLVEAQEPKSGNITFKPNSIPQVGVYYKDYSFVFEYKSYFIRVRPFVIYNGRYYGIKQIVGWLKTNYSNVNYKWLVNKTIRAIHYGYNLTKLPQNIADKIDYLGFRFVDLNFPFSWFDLEEVTDFDENYEEYNITRIHLKKANLVFSFEDLYSSGYSVEHINSTYVLIGNVRGKVDLIVDPITFSGGIITVIGGTEANPYTFWDLWNASNVNGWNVVHNNNNTDTQFEFDARVVVGDGSTETWFEDSYKQVVVNTNAISAGGQIWFQVKANAHARFGLIQDASIKATYGGCDFVSLVTAGNYFMFQLDSGSTNDLYFYSTGFSADVSWQLARLRYYGENGRVWNSIFKKESGVIIGANADVDVFNSIFQGSLSSSSANIASSTATFDRLSVFTFLNAFYTSYGSSFTVTNAYLRGNTYTLKAKSWTGTGYFVDFDNDNWNFSWSGTSTGKLYRQYSFDLTVLFENQTAIPNANVSLTDVDGTELFNIQTNSSGQIPTQTVTYGYYNQTGGDTIYLKSPHTLKVFKKGIRMYKSTFYFTKATELTLTMTTRGWHTGTKGITFQPNTIPQTQMSYSDYTFYVWYKHWYLGIRPFAIYNGQIYKMRDIVSFLKSKGANYKTAIRKLKTMFYYGFNLTRIPENVASNLDYIGFKLVDYNFPLTKIEKKIIKRETYNVTRLRITEANLLFTFEDLQERGYTVSYVNKTYLLVGNVKKTNLDIDPVVYSSNIITVTGFTSSNPCTFQDIVDVNDENGWGIVDAIGVSNFIFEARVVIGDGSTLTYFNDTDKYVVFTSDAITAASQSIFKIRNNATFILGQLDNAEKKITSHGVVISSEAVKADTRFVLSSDANVTIGLYRSTFAAVTTAKEWYHKLSFLNPDNTVKIYSVTLDNTHISQMDNVDIYDLHITRGKYGIYGPLTDVTSSKISILGKDWGIYALYSYAVNISDVEIRDIASYTFRGFDISVDNYLVDITFEAGDSGTSWITGTGKFYIQYSFTVNVTDSNGNPIQNAKVTVRHYGENAGQDFTVSTYANGSSGTRTLTYGFYNATYDNFQDYNPYNITIIASGYQTYTQNFTLNQKTDWAIALTPSQPTATTFNSTYYMLGFTTFLPILLLLGYIWRKKSGSPS